MRIGEVEAEVRGAGAKVVLDLDGKGTVRLSSGSAFLDHMLHALSRTGGFDLEVEATGYPYFRTVAVGMALGGALDYALGERRGIQRYGWAAVPMDEALCRVALDLSGRPYLVMDGSFSFERIGDLESNGVKALLEAVATAGRLTLNVAFEGENDHHKAESVFKALGLALREAVSLTGNEIPSTKGLI